MAKLTNFKAQQVEFPTHYELTDTGRGNNIKNIVPAYGTVREQGTPETSEIYNGLQLGNVHTLQATKTTLLNIDYYECNLEGLNEFGLNTDLKIRLTVDSQNANAGAKLRLNGVDYTILKEKNGQLGQIEAGDFKANKTYELTYNGSQFIVINLINPATETEAGLVTLNQIKGLIPTIPEASESRAGLITLAKIKELEGTKMAQMMGAEYGGLLQTPGQKEVGKAYYDSVNKQMVSPLESNALTYYETTKFIPISGLQNGNKVNSFNNFFEITKYSNYFTAPNMTSSTAKVFKIKNLAIVHITAGFTTLINNAVTIKFPITFKEAPFVVPVDNDASAVSIPSVIGVGWASREGVLLSKINGGATLLVVGEI